AAEIARWGAGLPTPAQRLAGGPATILASAYLEAPGVTLAGGTSEIMLQLIAASLDTNEQDIGGQGPSSSPAAHAATPGTAGRLGRRDASTGRQRPASTATFRGRRRAGRTRGRAVRGAPRPRRTRAR